MPNIYQVAMFNAQRHPDKVAVSESGNELSFERFCARARALAGYLADLGVQKGDRVAAVMSNSIDYLALLHATALTGFILVPVNTRYSEAELEHLLSDCRPKVVIVEPRFQTIAVHLKRRFHGIRWIEGFQGGLPEPTIADPVICRFGVVDDDDVAVIMYTSGTTSSPKGAMLTHGNLSANAVNYIMELGITHKHSSLLATPLFHIGGFGVVNGPILYAGGTLHIVPLFEATEVLDALVKYCPTHVFLLSAMWVSLTDNPRFSKGDFSFTEFVQTAGAPLGEWRQQLIRKVFSQAEFSWGFGMTESCVTTIKNRYTQEILEHPGSVGYLWRHVQYRLLDEDGRVIDDPGKVGELHVRGPTVFKGYWGQPGLTQETLSPDGWLKTGDLFTIDAHGYGYFLGRSKDMVKTGGENVAALEVENCLVSHPAIRDAAVFGIPHEYWGEELVAAVVPIPDATPDPEELRSYCRKTLSGFKVPKRIFLVDELPQSSSGKVQKFLLKERFCHDGSYSR